MDVWALLQESCSRISTLQAQVLRSAAHMPSAGEPAAAATVVAAVAADIAAAAVGAVTVPHGV